jgi:putative ABC transport system permease protein
VSVGSSAGQLLQNQLQSIGSNFIVVQPRFDRRRGGVQSGNMITLTDDDARAIGRECSSVLAFSPLVFGARPVVRGNTNMQPKEMWGVGVDYLRVRSWEIEAGGFFTERDERAGNCVCVIGYTVVRELFPSDNPVGQQIRIGNIPFTIVGVLGAKGASLTGDDQDNVVLMPYTTVKRRLQGSSFNDVAAILVGARGPELIETARGEITALLRDRHRIAMGQKADFEVVTSEQLSQLFGTITGMMTALLASIAGISLLVGGVGIMNIMLVSVSERTREIGIRMAMGARGRDILVQFLIESVVLSCFGGVIGLAMGIGASVGITKLINTISPGADWPVVVSIPAGIVAMVFAACVGLVFGLYPAWRASCLDPIDALRYE